MKLDNIKTIGIAGAGTMGSGIAQICAAAGFQTILFDMNEAVLSQARIGISASMEGAIQRGKLTAEARDQILSKIIFTKEITEVKADVIIEAIVEKLEIKRDLFTKLAEINLEETILASNTSSIPITQIARGLPNAGRVVGMHFFNPAHIMKLVEVISGAATTPEVAETIYALGEKLGKKAVMAKDAPGFIVNRVARHYYVEGLKLAEENVADFESIDALAEATGFKMGPFKLMDLIGVDVNFSVTSSMFHAFHEDGKFRPSRIQQQKVDAGFHGRKTGKGFYEYKK